VAGAILTMALAFPVAWLCVRHRGRLAVLLERGTYFGNARPGIVVALALVTVASRFRPAALPSVLLLLVLAYAIMFMPRTMVSIRAALDQAPPVFDDVAALARLRTAADPAEGDPAAGRPRPRRRLGAGLPRGRHRADCHPAARADRHPDAGTQFWSNSSSIAYGAAAPYAALMVILSAPVTLLLNP